MLANHAHLAAAVRNRHWHVGVTVSVIAIALVQLLVFIGRFQPALLLLSTGILVLLVTYPYSMWLREQTAWWRFEQRPIVQSILQSLTKWEYSLVDVAWDVPTYKGDAYYYQNVQGLCRSERTLTFELFGETDGVIPTPNDYKVIGGRVIEVRPMTGEGASRNAEYDAIILLDEPHRVNDRLSLFIERSVKGAFEGDMEWVAHHVRTNVPMELKMTCWFPMDCEIRACEFVEEPTDADMDDGRTKIVTEYPVAWGVDRRGQRRAMVSVVLGADRCERHTKYSFTWTWATAPGSDAAPRAADAVRLDV